MTRNHHHQPARRNCLNRRKVNLSQVFAGHTAGIKQVDDRLWIASFRIMISATSTTNLQA